MYAIIENGGKQYKAVEGGYIEIDLLPDEVGKKKVFDKVLLLSTDKQIEVGEPYLKGVSVDATITAHFKAPKITVFKYRAKQRYRVKTGHRQKYSRVVVDSIAFPGKSKVEKKADEPAATKKAAPAAKKPVAKKPVTAKKAAPAKAKTATKKPAASAAKKPAASKAKSTAKKKTTVKKPAASTTKKTAVGKAKPAAKKTTAKKTTAAKKKPSADKK